MIEVVDGWVEPVTGSLILSDLLVFSTLFEETFFYLVSVLGKVKKSHTRKLHVYTDSCGIIYSRDGPRQPSVCRVLGFSDLMGLK